MTLDTIPLILIFGISSVVVVLAYLLWLLLNYQSVRQHNDFLTIQFNERTVELTNLNNDKIKLIQQVEIYKTKIEYLEELTKNHEKIKNESVEIAKSALFNLGRDLSKQLIDLHKQENAQAQKNVQANMVDTTHKLNQEFDKIVQSVTILNHEIVQSRSAVDLVKRALLNPSGAGQLAEIALENILKNSGLHENRDFFMQYHISLKSGNLRPDAIVFLPGDNLMIIDAKASKFLVDIAAANEQDKSYYAEAFIKTMNIHLKQLSAKDYHANICEYFNKKQQTINHVITLMFLPSEQAVEQINNLDKNFIQRAWDQNIFPVGPAGLINMLSFAKFQISDQLRRENYELILEEVRRILSSISTLAEYSKKFGNNLQNMVSSYDKFAGSFNKNFLSKARHLHKLGITSVSTKDLNTTLERFQIVNSHSDLIEVESEEKMLSS